MTPHTPITDVHAHYLPREGIDWLVDASVPARLETQGQQLDCVQVGPISVGATMEQLGDVDAIRKDMEVAELDHRVLSTPPFTYAYHAETAHAVALCQRLNDALARVAAEHPDAFTGLAVVPLQDTDAALAELQRATGDLGLRGLAIGTSVGDETLGSDRLREVFHAAEEADLPILVHPVFVPHPTWNEYYLVNLLGMPVQTGIAVGNLVLSGALEQLPDLRLCFVHGGGVVPYLAGRWTRGWEVREDTSARTSKPPDAFIQRLYFDTLTHSPQALRFMLDVMGPERVVLGTDHPFDVRDPLPRSHLERAGVSGDERAQVEQMSARQWLHGGT